MRVFVTNQDIDLYNDTGMTQVKVTFQDIDPCPHFSKRL